MTTPTQAAMTIEGFAHQVEREFADLPQPVPNRLMADLDAHLRELAEHGDLLATVGRSEDYARDLREALELPGGSAGGSAPACPGSGRAGWCRCSPARGSPSSPARSS
jgi:hypothetical protein